MGQHAVDHGVAHRAVAAQRVVADDAVLLCAERLDRALRAEIEVVGPQAYDLAFQSLERVSEEKELTSRIHVAALTALCIPGIADLDPIRRRDDVVIPGAANNSSAFRFD